MMDDRTQPNDKTPQERGEFARYDRDLYSWAIEQAALLRAGRLAEADILNIAEEIDDVGSEQYDKLASALRVILLHLLKWDHQPERRSRVQRKHVSRVLRKNPGLKARVDEAVIEAYEVARIEAAAQTLLDEEIFALECPYTWRDITEREIEWPQDE
jgi:hypothetical protein